MNRTLRAGWSTVTGPDLPVFGAIILFGIRFLVFAHCLVMSATAETLLFAATLCVIAASFISFVRRRTWDLFDGYLGCNSLLIPLHWFAVIVILAITVSLLVRPVRAAYNHAHSRIGPDDRISAAAATLPYLIAGVEWADDIFEALSDLSEPRHRFDPVAAASDAVSLLIRLLPICFEIRYKHSALRRWSGAVAQFLRR
jgi:hypothetical protein